MAAPLPDISALLPPSLNLPPHLSAHKYFLVCTLTVAAWDTLVLSPRSWKLSKSKEWPPLKVLYQVLRFLMPIEFIIVAVAFFDTRFSQDMCRKFYLFEPICTTVLLACASAVHVIRIHAIYDKSRAVLGGLGSLFFVQVVVMALMCGFYRSVPLDVGQGCIAGPKENWVGLYWVAPTLFYTATFALAVNRSIQSLQVKQLSPWKLMLRDGLNLYAAIWLVNMVNVLFWLIVTPTGPEDTIKTTVTSMTTVLTTTMSMRIILAVRGSLAQGGTFAGASTHSTSRSNNAQNLSASRNNTAPAVNVGRTPQTYTLDEMRSKAEREWMDGSDGRSSVIDGKEGPLAGGNYVQDGRSVETLPTRGVGVKVTIDREVDYQGRQ